MSSISNIASVSSTVKPYLTDLTSLASLTQTDFGQTIKDFQAIGSAIQSGNVKTAQTALAAFQRDFPDNLQTAATQLFGKNNQANADFAEIRVRVIPTPS